MRNMDVEGNGSELLLLFLPVAVALLFAGLSLMVGSSFAMNLQFHTFQGLIVLVLPGLIAAMAIGQNVHAFSLWIAAIVNGALYGGLSWLVFFIRSKMRRLRRH